MRLFGIFDKVSGHYLAWLVESNLGTCTRAIKSRFANSNFDTFSGDFTLYHLADVDDSTGVISPVDPLLCCTFDEIFRSADTTVEE